MRFPLLLFGLLSACATDAPKPETPVTPQLQAATLLPSSFQRQLPPEPWGSAVVPPHMLELSSVDRPRAEMRAGPGVQFELLDATVAHGSEVLVMARYGVWCKVLVLGSWQKGWIHGQALSASKGNDRPLRVPMRTLPTVITVHGISSVRSFPSASPLHVSIPKGAQFRQLRSDERGALVWLPQTNSVMWLARKDIL